PQHRQRHPTGQGRSWQDERRFPCSGLDAVANGDQLGWSPFRAPHAIRLEVAIDVAPTASCSLQTDSKQARTVSKLNPSLPRCLLRPATMLRMGSSEMAQ